MRGQPMWERALLPVQRGEAPQPTMRMSIIPTKTKTKAPTGGAVFQQTVRRLQLRQNPTTPSRTSPSSSRREGKSLQSPKRRSKSPLASADSAPANASAIPNTARERSTSEKEKAKKPRLLYNFLASA